MMKTVKVVAAALFAASMVMFASCGKSYVEKYDAQKDIDDKFDWTGKWTVTYNVEEKVEDKDGVLLSKVSDESKSVYDIVNAGDKENVEYTKESTTTSYNYTQDKEEKAIETTAESTTNSSKEGVMKAATAKQEIYSVIGMRSVSDDAKKEAQSFEGENVWMRTTEKDGFQIKYTMVTKDKQTENVTTTDVEITIEK